MRAKQVGNLAGVKIIRGENDWKWYYLNEVSIRACPFEISRIRQQGSPVSYTHLTLPTSDLV